MHYIRQSIEVISSIDPAVIDDLTAGEAIGHGSTCSTYPLGEVQIQGQGMHLAAKVYENNDLVTERLIFDAGLVAMICEKAPTLKGKFPAFLGQLALGERCVILTEDVSKDHLHQLFEVPVSPEAKEALAAAFAEYGDPHQILHNQGLDSMAFMADGEERWLDFSMPPLDKHWGWPEYRQVRQTVKDNMDNLTVAVGGQTKLAQSMPCWV